MAEGAGSTAFADHRPNRFIREQSLVTRTVQGGSLRKSRIGRRPYCLQALSPTTVREFVPYFCVYMRDVGYGLHDGTPPSFAPLWMNGKEFRGSTFTIYDN